MDVSTKKIRQAMAIFILHFAVPFLCRLESSQMSWLHACIRRVCSLREDRPPSTKLLPFPSTTTSALPSSTTSAARRPAQLRLAFPMTSAARRPARLQFASATISAARHPTRLQFAFPTTSAAPCPARPQHPSACTATAMRLGCTGYPVSPSGHDNLQPGACTCACMQTHVLLGACAHILTRS